MVGGEYRPGVFATCQIKVSCSKKINKGIRREEYGEESFKIGGKTSFRFEKGLVDSGGKKGNNMRGDSLCGQELSN